MSLPHCPRYLSFIIIRLVERDPRIAQGLSVHRAPVQLLRSLIKPAGIAQWRTTPTPATGKVLTYREWKPTREVLVVVHVCSRDRGCTSWLVRIGAKVAFGLVRGLIEPARAAPRRPGALITCRCERVSRTYDTPCTTGTLCAPPAGPRV